jgi:hypothetical protein
VDWGYLYLIEDSISRLLKIGQTRRCPEERLRELQTGNPHPLRLCKAYQVQSVHRVEAALHRQFDHRQVSGEWFRVSVTEVDAAIQPWLQLHEVQHPQTESSWAPASRTQLDWGDLLIGLGFGLAAWSLLSDDPNQDCDG